MKLVKSLLLGSAAGIAAVAAAQAADLPSRKAAPAEYVRICDAYGAGFFYIPGTNTCLHVGGYVRAEYLYMSPQTAYSTGFGGPFGIVPSNLQDSTGFQGRGRVELDARTQTPWGTARAFIGLRMNSTSGPYAGNDNYKTLGLTGVGATTGTTMENAVIQFAGFTFGHTTADIMSFVPPEYYMPMYNYGSPAGFNLLAYTATFGGGFSATLGIEDRASMGWNAPGAATVIGNVGASPAVVNGPYTWPVLAGNIRLDQAWGSFQLSGGVIDNSQRVGPNGLTGFVKESVGWGITGGMKINLPMMGPGDHLILNAAYGDGFLDIVSSANTSAITGDSGRMFGGLLRQDSNAWVHQNAGCVGAVAACYSMSNSTGWSAEAFYDHYWSPTVRSVLMVGYTDITPPASVRNTDWAFGGLSEVKLFRVSVQPIVWNPVPGLELGGEVSYGHLDQTLAHAPGVAPTALPAGWPGPSSDSWQGRIRVTRQF